MYYYLFSILLRICGLFVKTENKLILFNSFGGKKYDDSPKAIYEAMLQDDRFNDYRKVWVLQEPDKTDIPMGVEVVKADTWSFFVMALKARVWVTNSSIERGLNFKKRSTLCLNTWHGTPIKKMGLDIQKDNKSFRAKSGVCADIMLAQGKYDIDVFSHAFEIPREKFCCIGLPRNDVLAKYTENDVQQIKGKIGIPDNKKVLLYAPTFREYTKGASNEVVLNIPMDLAYWQRQLGTEYVVLFRAHYEVAKHMELDEYPVFMDMSTYPNLNELMIVSDALISDYSSIYFDYSIMHKPMYCFAYDYDEYTSKRGMYLQLKDELPCVIHESEEMLIADILNSNESRELRISRTIGFQEKFVSHYGNAAAELCNIIYDLIC